MESRLLLQLIFVKWHKAARGGELAQRRARLPKAWRLPVEILDPPGSELPIHELRIEDSNRFAEPMIDRVAHEEFKVPLRIGCLEIEQTPSGAKVRYRWSAEGGGVPKRAFFDETGTETPVTTDAFSLAPGQWGRLEYNGRFTYLYDGIWYYLHVIGNIGLFEDFEPDVFMVSEPVRSWVQLGNLR